MSISPLSQLLDYWGMKRLYRALDIHQKRVSSRMNDMDLYRHDADKTKYEKALAEADALADNPPLESDYMPSKNAHLFWNALVVVVIIGFVVWMG